MNRLYNYRKEFDPRIKSLIRDKYYLEAFYIFSATIESLLQVIIFTQEDWINNLAKKSNLRLSKTPSKTLKEKTLGQLIVIFSKYCTDETLISQLNDFNSLRKKIVHRLLDHAVIDLNTVVEKKIANFYSLISKLTDYGIDLLDKTLRKFGRDTKKIKAGIN